MAQTFNNNQRTVEIPVPVNDLPTVTPTSKQQPKQQPKAKPVESNRTIVLPFIHEGEDELQSTQ